MTSLIESATYLGISAYPVQIEVDVTFGLPQFIIVGLPDPSIRESRERIRAAIKNSGFQFPPERITVNLAPADLKKEGSLFDLPIALGILAAADLIPQSKLKDFVFLGELALDGTIRSVPGTLIIASDLTPGTSLVAPAQNAMEAAACKDIHVYPARTLKEVVRFLCDEQTLKPIQDHSSFQAKRTTSFPYDFAEVRGQTLTKRAIEIAVAGGHNLLMVGPPGSGKSMLAKRIPSILPSLSFEQALEVTKIHSVSNTLCSKKCFQDTPPFRSPHHSSSLAALAGGGSWPKPGEVSLAHAGVLFLDEFSEFRKDALESLRGPLEDGKINVSRAKLQVTYPAKVMLVAAMNPCPCGYLTDPTKTCRCSLGQVQKYQMKLSGPILDRIDLHVEVSPVSIKHLREECPEETSAIIRKRIMHCHGRQKRRFQHRAIHLNAHMGGREIKEFASPDEEGRLLIEKAMKELHFSARAYFKILKLARTIADLAGEENVQREHIAEAIQYRSLDRQWQRN